MPDQDAQRIGPRVAVDLQRDHRLQRPEFVGDGGNRLEPGIVDGGDAVLRRAARHDLGEIDGVAREVGVRPFVPPARRAGIRARNRTCDDQKGEKEARQPARPSSSMTHW